MFKIRLNHRGHTWNQLWKPPPRTIDLHHKGSLQRTLLWWFSSELSLGVLSWTFPPSKGANKNQSRHLYQGSHVENHPRCSIENPFTACFKGLRLFLEPIKLTLNLYLRVLSINLLSYEDFTKNHNTVYTWSKKNIDSYILWTVVIHHLKNKLYNY